MANPPGIDSRSYLTLSEQQALLIGLSRPKAQPYAAPVPSIRDRHFAAQRQ
jgi:hypothetical protein